MSKGNILINGCTSVHAGSKGTLTTVDVCLTKIGTATVPIPYNNVAKSSDADKTASSVIINGNPACHKDSTFKKSTGDEPGKKKGLRSDTIQKQAEFVTASSNVFLEDVAAVRQGDMMVSNNCNTSPMPLTQPGEVPGWALEAMQAEALDAVEQPDRIDIGHIGEDTPLLKGRFQQSDPEESEDSTVYRRLSGYVEGENPQRYRELVINNVESGKLHRLSLVLRDHETNWKTGKAEYIVLPLGKTESVPKEDPTPEKPDEYANFTVPLVLKRYITSDADKSEAEELREGWIYIYLNGYLWRELQVAKEGICNDVNLQRHQGKDVRNASGEADSRVMVPWKINKQKPTIEIAFSEVQWSWTRINALGGMNPDTDFERRLKSDTPLSTVSESDAAKSRSARMQDITGELDRWIRNDGAETENIQLIDDVTAEIYTLQLNKQGKLPVVFLPDPLGIAKDLAGKYTVCWETMKNDVEALQNKPDAVAEAVSAGNASEIAEDPESWVEAATLANRYFYSKVSKEIPPGVKDKEAYKQRLTEIDDQFNKYKNKLDKPAIDLALRTSKRNDTRKKIAETRKELLDFLNKELADNSSLLVQALDDYFTLTPLSDREQKQSRTDSSTGESVLRWRSHYADGWQAVFDITAGLAKFEHSLDAHLEANPPDAWGWRRNNEAFEFMVDLADPESGNPLHSRLFPKAAGGDLLTADDTTVEKKDAAFKKHYLENIEAVIRRDPGAISGLAMFGNNFSEVMAMQDSSDAAYEERLGRAKHSVLRLVDSVLGLGLENTDATLEELIARQEQPKEVSQNEASLVAGLLKTISFMDKSIKYAGKIPESAEPGKTYLGKIRSSYVTAANRNRVVAFLRKLNNEKMVMAGLGGFLNLVEIHNFTESLKAIMKNKNDDRNWELIAPLAARALKLPAAVNGVIASVTKAMADPANAGEDVAERLKFGRAAEKAARYKMFGKLVQGANVLGDVIYLGVSLSSFAENIAQHDDAAIADAIQFTGATIGLIGTALSVPVLGWVAGAIGLAAWAAKAFLFKEDTPVEIWIANGPFSRGEESHEQFAYKRYVAMTQTKDDSGEWVDTPCTVYNYDCFEFLVDSNGTLISTRPQIIPWVNDFSGLPFKEEPDGTVIAKANPQKNIPEDTQVAKIGEPFEMSPILQTKVKETRKAAEKTKNTGAEYDPWFMTPPGFAPTANLTYENEPFKIEWENPHEAYLALADALYRPRVTLAVREYITPDFLQANDVTLNVKIPFFIPEKSKLHIDFEIMAYTRLDNAIARTFNTEEHIEPKPENIKELQVGPGEYQIFRNYDPGHLRNRKFIAKVRLDLYGDSEIELPYEPLFCESDIQTETNQKTVQGVQPSTQVKWIVAEKTC
jgi:hypothetical protein